MDFYHFKRQHPQLVMVLLLYVAVPLVMGLALGYEMHGDTPAEIPTVVVDADNSEFSREFISQVDKAATFAVITRAESAREAEQLIQSGQAMAGVIIPQDFAKNMKTGNAPDMRLLYDASQLVTLSVAKPAMTEIMMTMNGAYLQQIFAGKLGVMPAELAGNILPVNIVYRNLYNPVKSFRYYLLPGMLLAVLQVGIVMLGAERGFENKKERKFSVHLLNLLLWGLLGMLGVMVCLGVQFAFGLPFRGTLAGGMLLLFAYSLVITAMGYIMGLLIPDKLFAVQLASLLVLPTSVLGGYSYPLTAMPHGFQMLAKLLPYTYMGADLRALCLKPMQFRHVLPHLSILLLMAAGLLALLGALLLIKRKWQRSSAEEAAA